MAKGSIWGIAVAVVLVVASVGTALADVIDGNWCSTDGRHFSIRGSTIVTERGTTTQGDYSRHRFTYTVPASEPSPGTEIFMVLINELTVHLRRGTDASAPTETWRRCEETS
jgi:hypothetical protein